MIKCKYQAMGWIYNATNTINGKGYVGQTINPIEKRLKEHQQKSSNCRAFAGAIIKHGWDVFVIDWYECPDNELNKHERWMVKLMETLSPNGYNLREGGGNRGKASDETKQKISEARLGEKNPNFGKTMSEEQKKKLSDAQLGEKSHSYGKHHSEETRKKHSESTKGDKHHNSKRVYQYALDGTFVGSFGSTDEAGRSLDKENGSNIGKCARGIKGYKTAYKFKWSYELSIFM